jgi:hypothetical protein
MKMVEYGLMLALVSVSFAVQARTVVHNKSNCEVKVVVEIVGIPNWIEFPSHGVRRAEGGYALDNNVQGILPGKESDTTADLSNIKYRWLVWAKNPQNSMWYGPVDINGQTATGGIISPVNADVVNVVNEKGETVDGNGTPFLHIQPSSGW